MTPDFLRYLADFTRKEKATVGDLKEFVAYAEREFSRSALFHPLRWKNRGLPQSLAELKKVIESLHADKNQYISVDIKTKIFAINARRLARSKDTFLPSSRHGTQTLFDALLPPVQRAAQPTLADEIWLNILRYLSPGEVLRVAQVSQRANRFANDALLWHQLYQQATGKKYIPTAALPSAQPLLLEMLNNTWRALFAHPVLNAKYTKKQTMIVRLFPHGRQSLKTILSSPAPEGKGLVLLMQILSHQNIMKDYPEPAKTLFQSFLGSAARNFSLHNESAQTTLALRYQRLLLILEYAYLKQSKTLPANFPHTDESLSSRFSIAINADDFNNQCWDSLDTQLEEINTKKLIARIIDEGLVILTEDEFSTLSAEQILQRANENLLNRAPQNRKLALSSCGFSRLPKVIKYLTALEDLNLSGNYLTSLPPELGDLVALQVLLLNENQLTSLPPEIGHLTFLRNLGLNNNRLTLLPPEIVCLSLLQTLYLSRNQLTSLPVEICHLTNLNVLSFANNQLTFLPPEIGRLIALKTLFLSDNRLTRLPSEIGKLTVLQNLYLNKNWLTFLPAEMGGLVALQKLRISNKRPFLAPINLRNLLFLSTNETSCIENAIWVKDCSQDDIDKAFKKGIPLNHRTTLSSLEITMQKQLIASLFNGEITTKTLGLLDTIAKSGPSYPVLTKQLINVLAPVLLDNTNQHSVRLQTVVTAIRMVENNMPSPDAGNSNRPRASV